jgi:threonine/homoserine/homoserine lactone efflux protein
MNSLFFVGILAGSMLGIPVGPNGSLCLYRSVRFGWPQGLATALGSVMATCICSAGSVLIFSLFMKLISAKSVENVFGGICGTVSIALGIVILITSKSKPAGSMKTSVNKMFLLNFSSSFLIGMTNPKNIIGFAAFLMASGPKVGNNALTLVHAASFGCGVSLSNMFMFLLLIYLSTTVGERFLQRVIPKLKYWVASVFVFSGIVTIIKPF